MIPEIRTWQYELRHAINDPLKLLTLVGLSNSNLKLATQTQFKLKVPRGYVARMRYGDINDPLLRQVLPLIAETEDIAGFNIDPVGDFAAEKVPGLLQKYQGRVLLVTTAACAIHCRYCFRQHFDYKALDIKRVLTEIASDNSIKEVILSGGDPLNIIDSRLSELAYSVSEIPHIKRLRLHTRLPVVLPERVTDELLNWLTATNLQPVIVIHANHANEIDEQVALALAKLVDAGITVLNQSVLLRGINDKAVDLIELSETLFSCRVLPYYLHVLDKVQGAAHFEVAAETATELLEQMRKALPGYLVPRLVREVAGGEFKLPI
ncbi:EF-P beta-lysylation protein EpmB [Candidatus Marithrix sp. Canyon 246]|uniref:EF-P beta-lysylation protein EpmB n=1 Tax=Candidatus Marithrix sp. Canyon 246 TaxID=1827136 RepID=UPI00084A0C21|nr:EF-P beta-lysylation protein EpmB [Candidatus Marithrix sp. Canyon 246]